MRARRFVWVAVLALLGAVAPAGFAHADAPSPGDSCAKMHTTARDASGRTMWCNPTMTGNHSLVWQYGGPSAGA